MFQRTYNLCDVVSVIVIATDSPPSTILMAWDDQHHAEDAGPTAVDGDSTQRALAPFSLYHLPSEKVWKDSWLRTGSDLAAQLLGQAVPIALLKLYKIWVPLSTINFLHHVVYLVNVTQRQAKTVNRPKNYRWMTMEQLLEARGVSLLVSPEVISLMEMASNPSSFVSADRELIGSHHELFDDREVITEILHHNIWPNEENMDKSHLDVIKSSEISTGEQLLIYQDYILTCFPYILLNPSLFVRNIVLMLPKWSIADILQLFRAVDVNNRGYLTFVEYLTAFALCDVNTRHSLLAGELRCRYIFRYFDRQNVGAWNMDEFRNFLEHAMRGRNEPFHESTIETDLKNYSVMLGFRDGVPLTQHNFMRSAGSLRLRGTSGVLRFTKSLPEYMHIRGIDGPHFTTPPSTIVQLLENDAERDDPSTYTLALHAIRVTMPGNDVTVERLWKRPEVLAAESTSVAAQQSVASRRLSAEAFSSKTPANQVLSKLRVFMMSSGVKSSISWGDTDMHAFGTSLIAVCIAVKAVMQREDRMVNVNSPTYVIGDLHGNIQDLMHFEKMFWPLTPAHSPSNLLFLGDYVDRGQFGIEIIAYLFSYKMLSSHKVFMVRGNHETRDIQKVFTFYKECLSKFGETLGSEVWTAVNNAFDMMPLAALIDGRIFCCHGGIAPPWMWCDLTKCADIPVPLPQPDQQSDLAWNLMWNDPIKTADLTADVRKELEVKAGFIANTQRGTGYRFSEKAFNSFLAVNHLSHMIRAHELQAAGIQVQFDGKLLTVFSSSRYCGGSNDAAVIMVEEKRIRVIRLNTKVAK